MLAPGDMVTNCRHMAADGTPVWQTTDAGKNDPVGHLGPGMVALVLTRSKDSMVKVVADGVLGYCFVQHLEEIRTC